MHATLHPHVRAVVPYAPPCSALPTAPCRTPAVPYPFESREAYERSLRQPLGREYNTEAAFRDLTRPSVIKDAGVVIQPLKYSPAMARTAHRVGKDAARPPVTVLAGGNRKRLKGDKS